MNKQYYVYIMTNKYNSVLYTGVTNNPVCRVSEHKSHVNRGFTDKYRCTKLVWYEITQNIESAIIKEKQIKKWNREYKINMINSFNSEWKDLYESLL